MCQRGFSSCYNEYDVFEAIVETMCSKCPKQYQCGIDEEYDSEDEERCLQIEQMVTCIYSKFFTEEGAE